MKKALSILCPAALLAAACSPLVYPSGQMPGPYGRYQPHPMAIERAPEPAPLPVGRWDNVMMLAGNTPIQVLMMNGSIASGPIVVATRDMLRIHTVSGEVELAAADVMRIDRLSGSSGSLVRTGARGAAFGAGVVGVLGLIAGHVPPPRLFAAGGIIGAEQNIELAPLTRGASTIYLAPPPGSAGTRALR